jgi:hypothetical protein
VSRKYYYIDKRCKKMGAWKITREPMKKKHWIFITYERIEVQNWVVQKIKGLQNLINYIK